MDQLNAAGGKSIAPSAMFYKRIPMLMIESYLLDRISPEPAQIQGRGGLSPNKQTICIESNLTDTITDRPAWIQA